MKTKIFKTDPVISSLVGDSIHHITDKGTISLIEPCRATMRCYEIYCIKGELFDDVERYDTKEQVMERINTLLL